MGKANKRTGVKLMGMNELRGKWKERGAMMAGALAGLALLVLAAWLGSPQRGDAGAGAGGGGDGDGDCPR